MSEQLNGYKLTREWFNWCFDNPEKIKPIHTALYLFIVDHANRMGWKEKFGLPSDYAMEAIGVKNFKTYRKAFDDLVEFKAIRLIEKSRNQYTANVIALVDNTKAPTQALDRAYGRAPTKATPEHTVKQRPSTVGIDKPLNLETNKLITSVVEKLNNIAGTSYRSSSKKTQQHISARLAEGYTLVDFTKVIESKYKEWRGTEFEKYIRPDTLFGSKFEGYLNAIPKDTPKPTSW